MSTPTTAQDLLDQILGTTSALVKKAKATDTTELTAKGKAIYKQAEDALADKLGMGDDQDSRTKLRLGTAATAGALALLLSNRSKGKIAAMAGLGALGVVAYKAKQAGKMPKSFQDVVNLINNKAPANRADILLTAMIHAAKADGEISDEEAQLIENLEEADADDLRAVLAGEADPKAVAALAKDDQTALEVYAASCRIANGLNPRERDYLDRLAMELRLDPEMAARVETDMRTG